MIQKSNHKFYMTADVYMYLYNIPIYIKLLNMGYDTQTYYAFNN